VKEVKRLEGVREEDEMEVNEFRGESEGGGSSELGNK